MIELNAEVGLLLTRLLLLNLLVAVALQGCAWMPFIGKKGDQDEADIESTEQQLYERAQTALRVGNFMDGIEKLESLESNFPFGRYAEQAQLELIYANFMRTNYDGAIASAERFINLHPQHTSVDYAYYMKGLSSFQRDRGFFDQLLGTPEALRDVSNARRAFLDFDAFLSNFPDSLYSKDAYLRMKYLRNVLAESELNIAFFYLRRDAWVSAANRARTVIEHFPQSSSVPDALAVLVEANYKLELFDASEDALKILALNFPDYPAFDEEGMLIIQNEIRNLDRSFLNIFTLGLLDRPKMPRQLEFPSPPDLESLRPPSADPNLEANATRAAGRLVGSDY